MHYLITFEGRDPSTGQPILSEGGVSLSLVPWNNYSIPQF